MASQLVSELLGNPVDVYLGICQGRFDSLVEQETSTHVPPTAQETHDLINYLESKGVEAVIVGSVGVLHYVKDPKGFRPTKDLDLFVSLTHQQMRHLAPPPEWHVDAESIGVVSWISPHGGYVDFMTANYEIKPGEWTPRKVDLNKDAKNYPVATALSLFRLKLDTMRARDLADCVDLAKAVGVPTEEQLSAGGHRLTATQVENLDYVRKLVARTLAKT